MVIGLTFLFGLGSIYFAAQLPPMLNQGPFTLTAQSINFIGGLFFLAASMRYFFLHRLSHQLKALFYIALCPLTSIRAALSLLENGVLGVIPPKALDLVKVASKNSVRLVPAGALFVWLEAQLHDHGALPWGALREGLRGAELEPFVLKLMAEAPSASSHGLQKKEDKTAETNSQDAMREAQQELRALLNRMHIDRLKALETEVIEAAKADPTQLAKYKDIVERRKKLEASLVPTA